jgi:hypothetical protein
MASKKRAGSSLTTEILVQIRDEMRATREHLGGRLSELNERVDRLERRQSEDAVRLASELVAVASAVKEVRDLLRDQRVERERLEDHERRITLLEKRSA